MFSNILFRKSCRLWDEETYSKVGQAVDDNMSNAYCMLNNKILDYVVVTAFPQQHWLHKHTSTLRHMYIAYLFS